MFIPNLRISSCCHFKLLFPLTTLEQHTSRFLEAYLIGVEVMTRISKLLGESHYEKGFHIVATAGLYGAVAAGVLKSHFIMHWTYLFRKSAVPEVILDWNIDKAAAAGITAEIFAFCEK